MAKASKPITLREWQAIVDCYLERMAQPGKTDKDIAEINKRFEKATNDVLRMPVRSFDDLATLAMVAAHWNAPLDAGEQGLDKRSLACLIEGVLNLASVRLDSDGRLIG